MTILPLAEFMPDQPDLVEATDIAQNVIPRTASSYSPMTALARYSASALPTPCNGMIGVQNVDETIYIFAGTPTKLYDITGVSLGWNDVSGATYGAVTENWRFAQFNSLILATDYADPVQSFTMGSSTTFGTLSAAAPLARFIAVAKTFCILANTSDPVGGVNPARLWWSASNDPTNWPTPGSTSAQQVQSDYSDELGPQGDITGLAPNLAGCDCAVFFQRGVFRMIYVGPPDVFDFYPAENVRGTRYSNAIVPLGAQVYYLGEDGFYVFDGNTSTPIGLNKVDKWFFANLNQGFLSNVIGTADVINKAIIWLYPSLYSTGGVPDTALIYRWDIQRWSYGSVNAQWMTRLLSVNVTMDNMASLGFTNLDTVPFSLDSRSWYGGAPQTGFVDPNGYLAFFGPTTLQAQIGTKALQLFPNKLGYVQSARPLVDGGVPTIAMSARTNYYDAETFGPDVAPNAAGECPQRSVGRYHRARVTVPAGTSWTQAMGVDLTAIPSGVR